jgi:hypothetical protein
MIILLYSLILILSYIIAQRHLQYSQDYVEIKNTDHLLAVNVTIGYPGQNFRLLFDTYSEFTWVKSLDCKECSESSNYFIKKKSETLHFANKTLAVDYLIGTVEGEVAYDYISMKTLTVKQLRLIIAKKETFKNDIDGVLGVRRLYDKTDNSDDSSFMHLLKESRQIYDRIFSIFWSEHGARIVFGKQSYIPNVHGLPYAEERESFSSICNCDNNYKTWNCMISHILVGDDYNFYKAYKVDSIVEFATGVEHLYIPITYKAYFWDNYIGRFNAVNCKAFIENNVTYIKCHKRYVEGVQNIPLHFLINGWAYQLKWNDLFEEYNSDEMLFKIFFYESSTQDTFIFGNLFLRQYHMIFNGEENFIEFHGGFRYDFTGFTKDKRELTCWYNFFVYLFIIVPIIGSMIYIWYKKASEQRSFLKQTNNFKIVYKKL